MKSEYDKLLAVLKSRNIRLSHQRLEILSYLCGDSTHPTVEMIYSSMQKKEPTLSKMTIYNNLNAFIKAGIVKVVAIENNEARYDIKTEDHGHFKCEECGEIFDVGVDIDRFVTDELNHYEINTKNVYYTGICPKCRDRRH